MDNTKFQFDSEQSEHFIKSVSILHNYLIEAVFTNGVIKQIDLEPILSMNEYLAQLKDYNLFKQLHCSKNDSAIHWTNDIDLGCDYIWDHGAIIETLFDNLISMPDATRLWGLNESTLRKALQRGKLKADVDAKKFAGQWILIKAAIEREYGLSIPDKIELHKKALAEFNKPTSQTMNYYKDHPDKVSEIDKCKKQIQDEITQLEELLKNSVES